MEVRMLVVENLERLAKDVAAEYTQFIDSNRETDQERETRRIIEGDEDDERMRLPQSFEYVIDVSKYFKIVDFIFKKEQLSSLFMSTMVYKDEKIMVAVVDGLEYDFIYEEDKYKELVTYLNS